MASSVSPPKPWERAQNSATAPTSAALSAPSNSSQAPASSATAGTSSTAPAIPQRPSSLNSVVNRTASNYSNPSTSTLANRPYGSSPYGYGSSYSSPYGMSSPYSRFGGGYGSSMYGGGLGGGMYGGGMYGGGMYGGGYGGMYGGGPGMQGGDPNDPNSMTTNFAQSTQATFQIIESIVGAFGGFAQMLESTYMATHSSFFAMVSVAEQFGNLRQTLGSVLGIYTLIRWMRTLIAKLTGRPPPADATALTPASFAAFTSGSAPPAAVDANGRPIPRPSKKPFIVFMLAVFGLPYLMGKLIRALAKSQEAQQAQNQGSMIGPDGQPLPPAMQPQAKGLDPAKLDFCRVLYDFPPQEAVANGSFNNEMDLSVKKGDLVAVLDKTDPDVQGQNPNTESAWWRCRARDGRMGYLPAVYLETIQRRPPPAQITANGDSGSRANTMPSSMTSTRDAAGSESGGRAQTMSGATQVAPSRTNTLKTGKAEGLEKFQKAWINDS